MFVSLDGFSASDMSTTLDTSSRDKRQDNKSPVSVSPQSTRPASPHNKHPDHEATQSQSKITDFFTTGQATKRQRTKGKSNGSPTVSESASMDVDGVQSDQCETSDHPKAHTSSEEGEGGWKDINSGSEEETAKGASVKTDTEEEDLDTDSHEGWLDSDDNQDTQSYDMGGLSSRSVRTICALSLATKNKNANYYSTIIPGSNLILYLPSSISIRHHLTHEFLIAETKEATAEVQLECSRHRRLLGTLPCETGTKHIT